MAQKGKVNRLKPQKDCPDWILWKTQRDGGIAGIPNTGFWQDPDQLPLKGGQIGVPQPISPATPPMALLA